MARRMGCSLVVAIAVATAPALAQAANHPSPREKQAIEHAVSSLFRAIKGHEYQLACNQYIPKDRPVFVLVAEHLPHPPAIHDCAHALAAIEQSAHPAVEAIGPPQFKRITISGKSARVKITDTAPGQHTAPATVPLIRGPHGWKLELQFTVKAHPVSPA
jgi:hypothetical protein